MELNPEDAAAERQAARSKSSRGQIKFTARFLNRASGNVDLIWKDYDGKEVLVRQDIAPGVTHGECTYFTHPFLARDSETRKLRYFTIGDTGSKVFEGLNFNVQHDSEVQVVICDDYEIHGTEI